METRANTEEHEELDTIILTAHSYLTNLIIKLLLFLLFMDKPFVYRFLIFRFLIMFYLYHHDEPYPHKHTHRKTQKYREGLLMP